MLVRFGMGELMSTIGQCAKHIDISERRFYELIEHGVIDRAPKGKRGGYNLDVVRLAYLRHLREQAAGRGASEAGDNQAKIDLDFERARAQAARADKAEMEVALMRGELVPANEIADAISAMVSVVKQRLLAVPAKLAQQASSVRAPREVEKLIRDEITHALGELKETKIKD